MFEDVYDNFDAIPKAVQHLFKESEGKWILFTVGEVKTPTDVSRVQEGLRKERLDHKETKRKLGLFNGLDAEAVHDKLDRFAELEAASGGNLDDAKINEIVETRITSRTAPLERKITTLTAERDDQTMQLQNYELANVKRTIHDQVRKAGVGAKIHDTAIEDAMLIAENLFVVDETGNVVTKDNVGITPGIEPSVWFTEVKTTRPHWWPASQGVGAMGGPGQRGVIHNPFTKDNWNMTEQGRIVVQDRNKAEQLAKIAGTTIGGQKPTK